MFRRVSPAFCLLCLWFGWACGFSTLGMVVVSALAHELGHLGALGLFGARVEGIRVSVLGAVIEADTRCLSYFQELLVLLAGPGVNLLLAAALSAAGQYAFAGANGVLWAYNMLPLPPLDGGRALETALTWLLGPLQGERICRMVGIVTSLLLCGGLLLLMLGSGGSLWLLPSFLASFRALGRQLGREFLQ